MSIESSLFAFPVLSYQHLKIAINASMGESDVLEFVFMHSFFTEARFFQGYGCVLYRTLFFCFLEESFFWGGSRDVER